MGWFWGEEAVSLMVPPAGHPALNHDGQTPPPGCPMHNTATSTPSTSSSPPPSRSQPQPQTKAPPTSPYAQPPAPTPSTTGTFSSDSTYAALNPLNYMPSDLSQSAESSQQLIALPTERELSSIPRGGVDASEANATDANGNWVYPSPQQMYNAMLRKTPTAAPPADAVTSMVAVHNFLNEGAWAEIVEWERRFGRGLSHGWRACAQGEEGSVTGAMIDSPVGTGEAGGERLGEPKLIRFMGRSDAMTPKARMLQVMGWLYPSAYGGPAPFDRHDWYVERAVASPTSQARASPKQVRYIIDYYSAPPEPTGEPVFYLDIRPALDRPGAFAERAIRWGRDVWWTASGGAARRVEEVS